MVTEAQAEEFEKRGLAFPFLGGRMLQQIDIQNVFCEIDKYARVKFPDVSGYHSRTKIKQKFKPKLTPIEYFYPPKWSLKI